VAEILAQAERAEVQFVDLQFNDLLGAAKSVVIPAGQLGECLERGKWFDGSALEGAARLAETDLILRPDPSTWALLPWEREGPHRTARLICDILTPEGEPFAADPRGVLRRALQAAAQRGLTYCAAAEMEFFLFREPERAASIPLHPQDQVSYFDLGPDAGTLTREEIVQHLAALGVDVASSHHEVAPGQHEIDLAAAPALQAADWIMTTKFVARAVARRRGLRATFMPKPLKGAAGSGLHLHQSLLRTADGSNALWDPADPYRLSPLARQFLAGQLAHARALCAVLAPTVNSYKRLGTGYEAPVHICWAHLNRAALIRVPQLGRRAPQMAVLELRCADPSGNPYLALAAMLQAGLDGIEQGLEPPPPAEEVLLSGGGAPARTVEVLPASLGEALEELAWDPVVRGALGEPVYERLMQAREQEWEAYCQEVTPWELARYFDS